jgi:hypothetical protein
VAAGRIDHRGRRRGRAARGASRSITTRTRRSPARSSPCWWPTRHGPKPCRNSPRHP